MTPIRRSLQDLIDETPNLVEYFYHDTRAPHSRADAGLSAPFIPNVYTNWRDEQRAWRETAVLFNQTHHMPELFLDGPDGLKLLERIAINSFAGFEVGRAKQLVACNQDGFVIGDCVLYHQAEESFELVSGMTILDWIEFNAQAGDYDVRVRRDESSPFNATGRRVKYRYQVDGPLAGAILNEAVEGGMPELGFFRTAEVKIAGHDVLLLAHSMAGHNGAELSGAWEDQTDVVEALMTAGAPYGLTRAGTRTYFSSIYEGGWMAYPLPAIYTGQSMRGFREWLDANSWEANTQIAGSWIAPRIEDYYLRPWELGYGNLLKFDHDFIGRAALEKVADLPRRGRATLVWNHQDVLGVFASELGTGPRFKSMEYPVVDYGFPQADIVRAADGRQVGYSSHCGYSNNEGEMLSLAVLDPEFLEPGTEVMITWGEPDGGSRKRQVERHAQTVIRARVEPAPYAQAARLRSRPTGSTHR